MMQSFMTYRCTGTCVSDLQEYSCQGRDPRALEGKNSGARSTSVYLLFVGSICAVLQRLETSHHLPINQIPSLLV